MAAWQVVCAARGWIVERSCLRGGKASPYGAQAHDPDLAKANIGWCAKGAVPCSDPANKRDYCTVRMGHGKMQGCPVWAKWRRVGAGMGGPGRANLSPASSPAAFAKGEAFGVGGRVAGFGGE